MFSVGLFFFIPLSGKWCPSLLRKQPCLPVPSLPSSFLFSSCLTQYHKQKSQTSLFLPLFYKRGWECCISLVLGTLWELSVTLWPWWVTIKVLTNRSNTPVFQLRSSDSVFIEVDHMHPRHKSKIMIRVRKSQQDEVLVTASSAEQTHKWHLTVGYVQYSCIYVLQPLSLPGKHPLLSNITSRRIMFEAHFFSLCFKGFALN